MAKLIEYGSQEFKDFFGTLGEDIYCVAVLNPKNHIFADVVQYQFSTYQDALEWAKQLNAENHLTSVYKLLATGVSSKD